MDTTKSSVEDKASTFKIAFTKDYLDTIDKDTDITITYDAIITGTAVTVGEEGNDNTATLTYGHDNDENKSEDSAKVYTAQISVIKNDGESKGLAGAVFALKNSEGKYYIYNTTTGEVTWGEKDAATTFTSGSDGKLDGEFKGLSNGIYTLEEVTVPDGYNAIDPTDSSLTITIADKDYTDSNLKQETTVINNAGATLPSTGGIGTTIFYIVGAILVIGAGVMLVTRRRMRAE